MVEDMIVFARVFETGSVTRAARALGSTRSAVSKSIARLENQLGARLLQRTTRQVSATAAGQACYVHCSRVAAEVEAVQRTASEIRSTPMGPLRVSCASSVGALIGPAIPGFVAKYPRVSLEVELNENVVDLVAARIDVGVRIGRVTDDSVVGRRLATYRRVLVASPRYLAKHGTPRAPEDCASHACVLRTGHDEWRFERGKRVVSVRVSGTYRTDALELVRHAALADAGLAIMPSFAAAADIAAGRLVRVLQRFEPELAIYAVYPNQRHLAPSARAFVDFLIAEVPARLASHERK